MISKFTAQATSYIPLIARASAAELCPDAGFVDDHAKLALQRLGVEVSVVDFHRDMMRGCVLRAKLFDDLCLRYLSEISADTVIEVGAGFETRPERLDSQVVSSVRWFHVDLPEVVEHRRSHGLDNGATVIAADVSTSEWVEQTQAVEKPCILLSEGLTYHLSIAQVWSMLEISCRNLPPGSILIHDFMSPFMRRFHPGRKEVAGGFQSAFRTGAELYCRVSGITHLYDSWDLEKVNSLVELTGRFLRRSPWQMGMYGVAVGEVRG